MDSKSPNLTTEMFYYQVTNLPSLEKTERRAHSCWSAWRGMPQIPRNGWADQFFFLVHFQTWFLIIISNLWRIVHTRFLQCATAGNLKRFRELHAEDPSCVVFRDAQRGRSSAHYAAAADKIGIIEYIAQIGGGKLGTKQISFICVVARSSCKYLRSAVYHARWCYLRPMHDFNDIPYCPVGKGRICKCCCDAFSRF